MSEPTIPTTGVIADAGKSLALPVYNDLVHPAAVELGKGLQTVARTVHLALAPVSALIWGYEKIAEHLTKRLTEKLAGTPPERIVPPQVNVAGPAIEAMRFTGGIETLREMYASLLAASMDSATTDDAHPAFVEIIRQLTPDEARILAHISNGHRRPVINIHVMNLGPDGGTVTAARWISMIDEQAGLENPGKASIYFDNLNRLGLTEIPDMIGLTKQGLYDELENHANVLAVRRDFDARDGYRSQIERRFIALTSLGRQFVSVCVLPRQGEASPPTA